MNVSRRWSSWVAVSALITGLTLGSALFAQTPAPVNFVSAHLYSGVGYGDRIAGAANVYTVGIGDFNNDGKLDFVAANNSNVYGLGLVLGNGDGTFQTPTLITGFTTGGVFGGIAPADFDKDGKLDFAVVWTTGGPLQLSIYMGDGLGHFTLKSTYSIGIGTSHPPLTIATGDVNGDGIPDVIVPDSSNGTVAVFLGKGDGTFPNSAEYPAAVPGATAPTAVAVADLNKDGRLDIVAASSSGCCPWGGGIHVLLGNGNGTFQNAVFYPNPQGVDGGQLVIADLDANGKLDVVESSYGGWNVAVFLGNGDGTFQTAKNYTVESATSVAVGNLTSDKKPEIVVTSSSDSTAYVLLNKGSGVFQVSNVYSTDFAPQMAYLADFNKDGKLDLLVTNANGQYVTVALGNGDGTFRDSVHYNETPGSLSWANAIAVADFNLDGNPDVIEAGGGALTGLSLMLGNSHGLLKAPTAVNLGASAYNQIMWVLAGDVNNDGKPDVVCSTPYGGGTPGAIVLLGKGTATLGSPATYSNGSTAYAGAAVLADVNGDGKPDIVTSNWDGSVSILLNKGKGTFGTATVIPSVTGSSAAALATGDFNGDGKLDIVLADFQRVKVVLLLGNGNGTFQSPIEIAPPLRPSFPLVGDFNKDGKLDLALPSNDGTCSYCGGSMAILYGNGNGTFTQGPIYYFYPQDNTFQGGIVPSWGTLVDLNGDGNLDIALASTPNFQWCGNYRCAEQYMGALVFLGDGKGNFVEQSGWLPGATPYFVAAADFNGDGMPDLAFLNNNPSYNYWNTSVTILQNATQPVSVSPLNIKWGTLKVGASSLQTVVLTNDLTTSLGITSVALGGANPGDFVVKSLCGTKLAAGANCTINVTFKPVGVDTRSATLLITDAAGTQTVGLTGSSTEVTLSPTTLAFGSVTVGQTKMLTTTLTNTGSTVLSIVSPGITITGTASADYSQTNTCGTSVPGGGNCSITVTFKPTKTGSRPGTLNINDNGGLSPQKVTLTGSGI